MTIQARPGAKRESNILPRMVFPAAEEIGLGTKIRDLTKGDRRPNTTNGVHRKRGQLTFASGAKHSQIREEVANATSPRPPTTNHGHHSPRMPAILSFTEHKKRVEERRRFMNADQSRPPKPKAYSTESMYKNHRDPGVHVNLGKAQQRVMDYLDREAEIGEDIYIFWKALGEPMVPRDVLGFFSSITKLTLVSELTTLCQLSRLCYNNGEHGDVSDHLGIALEHIRGQCDVELRNVIDGPVLSHPIIGDHYAVLGRLCQQLRNWPLESLHEPIDLPSPGDAECQVLVTRLINKVVSLMSRSSIQDQVRKQEKCIGDLKYDNYGLDNKNQDLRRQLKQALLDAQRLERKNMEYNKRIDEMDAKLHIAEQWKPDSDSYVDPNLLNELRQQLKQQEDLTKLEQQKNAALENRIKKEEEEKTAILSKLSQETEKRKELELTKEELEASLRASQEETERIMSELEESRRIQEETMKMVGDNTDLTDMIDQLKRDLELAEGEKLNYSKIADDAKANMECYEARAVEAERHMVEAAQENEKARQMLMNQVADARTHEEELMAALAAAEEETRTVKGLATQVQRVVTHGKREEATAVAARVVNTISGRKVFARLYGDAKARVQRLEHMSEVIHKKESAALLETIPTVDKREEIEDEMQYDWTVRVQNFAQLGARPTAAMRPRTTAGDSTRGWERTGGRQLMTNSELARKFGTDQSKVPRRKMLGMSNSMSVTSVFPETKPPQF